MWCGNMDDANSSFNWEWDYQEQAHEPMELKLALFYSTLDLETGIAYAHQEIARKRDEVSHYKCLLTKIVKDRDEFQIKCRRLLSKNLILQQEVLKFEANASSFVRNPLVTYIDRDPVVEVVSSSGSNEKFDRIQETDQISLQPRPTPPSQIIDNMVLTKGLPKNGKFLQAMMEARPLLQTLLTTGPLPEWHNPPLQLSSIKIPVPTIPLSFATTPRMLLHQDSRVNVTTNDDRELISKKRGLDHSYEVPRYDFPSTANTKNQKVLLQSPLTNIL